MKRIICTMAMFLIPMALLHATETANWDIGNNTVTYSTSVSGLTYNNAQTVYLSQFNTANAIAAGEASGSTYTLTSIVLSINGAISGTLKFVNTTDGSLNVAQASVIASPGFVLTSGANQISEAITYIDTAAPFSVAGNSTVRHSFSSVTGTQVQSANISSALAAYVGSGTFASTVSQAFGISAQSDEDIASSLSGSMGSANVSITYHYSEVPEPSSLALLGLGCAAIASRRRLRKA